MVFPWFFLHQPPPVEQCRANSKGLEIQLAELLGFIIVEENLF